MALTAEQEEARSLVLSSPDLLQVILGGSAATAPAGVLDPIGRPGLDNLRGYPAKHPTQALWASSHTSRAFRQAALAQPWGLVSYSSSSGPARAVSPDAVVAWARGRNIGDLILLTEAATRGELCASAQLVGCLRGSLLQFTSDCWSTELLGAVAGCARLTYLRLDLSEAGMRAADLVQPGGVAPALSCLTRLRGLRAFELGCRLKLGGCLTWAKALPALTRLQLVNYFGEPVGGLVGRLFLACELSSDKAELPSLPRPALCLGAWSSPRLTSVTVTYRTLVGAGAPVAAFRDLQALELHHCELAEGGPDPLEGLFGAALQLTHLSIIGHVRQPPCVRWLASLPLSATLRTLDLHLHPQEDGVLLRVLRLPLLREVTLQKTLVQQAHELPRERELCFGWTRFACWALGALPRLEQCTLQLELTGWVFRPDHHDVRRLRACGDALSALLRQRGGGPARVTYHWG